MTVSLLCYGREIYTHQCDAHVYRYRISSINWSGWSKANIKENKTTVHKNVYKDPATKIYVLSRF